jgi:hypothetical protein
VSHEGEDRAASDLAESRAVINTNYEFESIHHRPAIDILLRLQKQSRIANAAGPRSALAISLVRLRSLHSMNFGTEEMYQRVQ